jgi:hypothetical protein
MSLRTVRSTAFSFLMLLAWLPLVAQTSSYHTTLSNDASGAPQIILVNDSNTPIEAFHILQQCQSGGSWSSRDALDGPGMTASAIQGANGGQSQTLGVQPNGTWNAGFKTQIGANVCGVVIDALFFADGSYQGKDAVVRSLKARRDGIAAGVSYWTNRFSALPPSGSNLSPLLAEATRLEAADLAMQNNYPFNPVSDVAEPLLRAYWAGKYQVDSNVANLLTQDLASTPASGNPPDVAGFIAGWQQMINSDLSMQKLNSTFPPITAPAGNSGNTSVTQ